MSIELIRVVRGSRVESIHRGDAVAVDGERETFSLGCAGKKTYFRSAAKPLMAACILSTGAGESFGLGQSEIALMAASHSGEDRHLEVLGTLLGRIGHDASDLNCGSVLPGHRPTRERWLREGRARSPAANNCSGKHAGMLLACRHLELPVTSYLNPEHHLQRQLKNFVARACGLGGEDMATAIDGCGVPVYWLPLKAMASGFSSLVDPDPERFSRAEIAALRRVAGAMTEYPELVAGEGRFCTELMTRAGRRLVAKGGAEGVYCVGHRDRGAGFALKIEDGNARAVPPAVTSLLEGMGWIEGEQMAGLARHRRPRIKNTRGQDVGYLECIAP